MAAKKPKNKVNYARPTQAIEKGGAFYVPGLEGTGVYVAGASVAGVGLILNRLLSPNEPEWNQVVSEVIGVVGIVYIYVQAFFQERSEKQQAEDDLRAAFAARQAEVQEVGAALVGDEPREGRARWAATALQRVTPARAVVWVGGDGEVLLRFGRFPASSEAKSGGEAGVLGLRPAGSGVECLDVPDTPRAPLPSNAASIAVCRCRDGVLALASEQANAFDERHAYYLEQCVKLIEIDDEEEAASGYYLENLRF